MNIVVLTGNLGRDPELKKIGEKVVANLSIAVNEVHGDEEETSWFDLTAWGKTAEIASNLRSGERITVQGKLKQRRWTDEKTKEKKSKVSVTIFEIQKNERQKLSNEEWIAKGNAAKAPIDEPPPVEIPF